MAECWSEGECDQGPACQVCDSLLSGSWSPERDLQRSVGPVTGKGKTEGQSAGRGRADACRARGDGGGRGGLWQGDTTNTKVAHEMTYTPRTANDCQATPLSCQQATCHHAS